MKKVTIGVILASVCFCLLIQVKGNNGTIPQIESAKKANDSNSFLSLFSPIEKTTLHLYSPSFEKNGKIKSDYPYKGTTIPTKQFEKFLSGRFFPNLKLYENNINHLYAVGKIKIDDNFIGLLFRQRSQYDESLIQLMLWDINKHEIVGSIDIADNICDENWCQVLESWVLQGKHMATLQIVIRKVDKEQDEESDVYKTTSDSLSEFTLKGIRFTKHEMNLVDTLNYKMKNKY